MPKAVNVSHARVMQWGLWFAGMMDAQPSDRLYNCLPMYHSVGGVLAPGAMLAAGGSLVVRERFSASQFWSDIIRWECTAFQYIGELCRYLLHRPYAENETAHRLRLACGNGLAAGVWEAFQQRFRIPQILEFYAATEGGISLFNVQGKPGAIGHIPPYLAHRFAPALVAFDFDKGEPIRNENGFCIRCGVNEPGEAIGKVQNDPANAGSRFEGYTSAAETEKKILRHVFAAGDAWVRTGDLMRQDEKGFFYFVDRIGDTFRWKGENVATSEVAQALCAFEGITACQRLRSRDSGDRRPRRDGGHRLRRCARSRRAAPASRRAAARLCVSAFSSALSAGRVNRHLQILRRPISSGRDSTRANAPTRCTSIIPSCAPTPHSTRRCTTASSQEPSGCELEQPCQTGSERKVRANADRASYSTNSSGCRPISRTAPSFPRSRWTRFAAISPASITSRKRFLSMKLSKTPSGCFAPGRFR